MVGISQFREKLCDCVDFPPQEEEEYETKGGRRRTWDDDYVLKRQFSALVPAFDPRPGRTNVQQTTDLEIPPPGTACLSVR